MRPSEIVSPHPLIKGMDNEDQDLTLSSTQLDLGASVLWNLESAGQQRQRKYTHSSNPSFFIDARTREDAKPLLARTSADRYTISNRPKARDLLSILHSNRYKSHPLLQSQASFSDSRVATLKDHDISCSQRGKRIQQMNTENWGEQHTQRTFKLAWHTFEFSYPILRKDKPSKAGLMTTLNCKYSEANTTLNLLYSTQWAIDTFSNQEAFHV